MKNLLLLSALPVLLVFTLGSAPAHETLMVAQLRAAGVIVEEPKSYLNGDFARLHDPEGNPIEL